MGFFAGLLLAAYALPYLHRVACGWERLLSKCIPSILQYSRDEEADFAKTFAEPIGGPDFLFEGGKITVCPVLTSTTEVCYCSVLPLNFAATVWARPPPGQLVS